MDFVKDNNGNKTSGHPYININVEGEEIAVLFDTGATFYLSDSAQVELKRKEQIGGSFIAKSLYEKWHSSHPEWKIIEGGNEIPEGGKVYRQNLIEVPSLKLGTYEVGPVWFAVQPDQAWSNIIAGDKKVKGALGGSALQYVSVTIDYPKELLKFEK